MNLWVTFLFLDASSPMMENLVFFHDHIMIIILVIIVMILYILIFMIYNLYIDRFLMENQFIEVIWTIFPVLFLIFIAVPSLKILYLLEDINNMDLSFKVIGHQWYWSFEFENTNYSTFMNKMYNINMFRLLDVDNHFIVPYNLMIRFLVTSSDVIHSFTLPSLGLKIDAIPGRLNQVFTIFNRVGLFYGQCSEICGVNHSFMPVVLEACLIDNFLDWMNLISIEV